MRALHLILPLLLCSLLHETTAARRVRIRPRPIQPRPQESEEELPEAEISEEDSRPQPALQYYNAEEPDPQNRIVLVDDSYNGLYAQQSPRTRTDYNQRTVSISRSTTPAPRAKEQATKSPPVQTIRNYSKVNDDGSFTFGYEAADGSFKEETRGTDCVVRGKYGYIDPDGNKREFTYVSGNPCDPNNPDGHDSVEDDRDDSPEDSREPENVPQNYPQNYPKRPVRPVRPLQQTTTHAPPTTVFQNTYSHSSLQGESDEEEPEPIQVLQQTPRPRLQPQPVQPLQRNPPSEVAIRQRPRITVVNTTPAPLAQRYPTSVQSISITPRPTYRTPIQTLQTQTPSTTYRPILKATQTPAPISYSKPTQRPIVYQTPAQNAIQSTTRRPVDFAAEFQKFQREFSKSSNTPPITTTSPRTTTSYSPAYKAPAPQRLPEVPVTSNPVYESQLIYDPSSGQYDSALYQQLPQTDGDFQLSHRIQPYVHQPQQAQLLTIEQLQQAANPIFRTRATAAPIPQFSQQVYEKERENLQVLNSQQLFQQQQELQQQQLHQDRIESARKAAQQIQVQPHRFQPQLARPVSQAQSQGYYFIQPSSGQIDAFLRGHNLDF